MFAARRSGAGPVAWSPAVARPWRCSAPSKTRPERTLVRSPRFIAHALAGRTARQLGRRRLGHENPEGCGRLIAINSIHRKASMDVMDDTKLVKVLRALGEAKRFRMVQELAAAGELSCSQLGTLFRLSQSTISHHLKILADAGVLVARQEGQHHFISVNQDAVAEVAALVPARLSGPKQKERKNAAGKHR